MDAEGLFGEERFDVFGPLHQAEAAAVDVVVKADVERFFQSGNPVEIKVVDGFARAAPILVHNGKRGRADGIFPHPQPAAEGRGKGGLSRPHGREECKDVLPLGLFQKLLRSAVQVIQIPDNDFVFHDSEALSSTTARSSTGRSA